MKKKNEYYTENLQIKKGLTVVSKKGHITIQNLSASDIHISFSEGHKGISIPFKGMRSYTLDGEVLFIKCALDGEIVIEGISA